MRLKLTNFGCYTDKSFDFGMGPGIILIHGQSGVGKSTIVRAIQFAIRGKCDMKTAPTFGGNTCRVELTYGSLHISRTKPARLVVNNEYIEEVAQQLITNEFGPFERFQIFLRIRWTHFL